MRKEARRGECEKCGKVFYVHGHHILPKSLFGKGETIDLCPNCHTHFHEYSNLNTKNPQDKAEALKIWNRWLKKVVVICFVIGAFFLAKEFLL